MSPRNNITITTDVVLFCLKDNRLQVLTILRNKEPFNGMRTLPGGFVREGETTKDAAMRVLREKAGLTDMYIEQLYTFDNMVRDPRGQFISVTYMATCVESEINFDITEKTEKPQFTPYTNHLGFDHNDILDYAAQRLRYKLEYTTIISSLLPKKFTFLELQSAYESILEKPIDKRNFRKKFMSLGLIEETGEKQQGLQQRPALLYRFKTKEITELKKFF